MPFAHWLRDGCIKPPPLNKSNKKDFKTFTSAGLAAATPLTAGCSVSAGATGSASGAVPFTLAGETAGGGWITDTGVLFTAALKNIKKCL